jgi:hypothetical protein
MKPVSGGCGKRENPGGQPPTLVSYEATAGTEFTEFVFSTWIFRMYRIGGEGREIKWPRLRRTWLIFDIHRPGNIWRGFILGILYIDFPHVRTLDERGV